MKHVPCTKLNEFLVNCFIWMTVRFLLNFSVTVFLIRSEEKILMNFYSNILMTSVKGVST